MTFQAKTTLDGKVAVRSRHSDDADDDIWTDWYPCIMGTVETIAPELGDSRPGDLDGCWGYTCVSTDTEVDDKQQHLLVVTWKRPKRLDSDVLFSEIKRVPGYGVVGKNYGTRVFLAPDATAEYAVETYAPVYTVWPSDTSAFPRMVVDVQVERNWRVGLARIVIQYAVLSQVEWLVSNIGKGLLVGAKLGGEPITLNYDLGGAPAAGFHFGDTNTAKPIVAEGLETVGTGETAYTQRFRWSLYWGSNVALVGVGVYVVRVALLNPWAGPIATLIGRWNASACIHIAMAQIGQLKLVGFESERVPNMNGVHVCDFHLAFNSDGWAQGCMAKKEIYKVVDLPVLKNNAGGTDTMALSQTGYWEQALDDNGDSVIEDRLISRSDAGLMFTIALIDGYLTW